MESSENDFIGKFPVEAGQFEFIPMPEFDDTPIELVLESEDDGESVTVHILSGSAPGSVPSISHVLHDRMSSQMWMPGINLDHEQALGLVVAFPCWD